MTDVELLVDIRKASDGRPVDLANWPNHGQKSIVPACSMQFEILSLDRFWSKAPKGFVQATRR